MRVTRRTDVSRLPLIVQNRIHHIFRLASSRNVSLPLESVPHCQVNTKAWTGSLKRAGIENLRWHDLRHMFATALGKSGVPTHEVQRLGGWMGSAMLDRFAHVNAWELQEASARLDALFLIRHGEG